MLLTVGEGGEPLSSVSLARKVGLHPTTTIRMLESLKARGMVRQRPDGLYELGPRVIDLSHAYLRRLSIASHANELAEALARRTDETASVGVLDDGQVLYIAIAHGQSEIGIQSSAFARHPVHCTALGKAMLAQLPWADAALLLTSRPRDRQTANTLTDLDAVRDDLARIAARGYSVDDEERVAGVRCIGAPIRDHRGITVAAISISGPAFRVTTALVPDLAAAVIAVADEASARLGAQPRPAP